MLATVAAASAKDGYFLVETKKGQNYLVNAKKGRGSGAPFKPGDHVEILPSDGEHGAHMELLPPPHQGQRENGVHFQEYTHGREEGGSEMMPPPPPDDFESEFHYDDKYDDKIQTSNDDNYKDVEVQPPYDAQYGPDMELLHSEQNEEEEEILPHYPTIPIHGGHLDVATTEPGQDYMGNYQHTFYMVHLDKIPCVQIMTNWLIQLRIAL